MNLEKRHLPSSQFAVYSSLFVAVSVLTIAGAIRAERQHENLGRGLIALRTSEDRVFLSWRLLASDLPEIAFHVYRSTGQNPVRLNADAITDVTWFLDQDFDASKTNTYFVEPVLNDRKQLRSASFELRANSPVQPYLSIPLQTPDGCTPNDASVGDLDGDGEYEVVIKQEMRGIDNSRSGFSGQTKLEAYKLDGTLLWRIDLGRNIREGAHYTQFIVYDLDGDGRAEVACKTADGTVDGTGKTIGDANADYRDQRGYVLDGPEYLTIFDGRTGAELVSTAYIPPRGNVRDWGDDYGNRVDRFLACVAYLDGERPSLVMCRGEVIPGPKPRSCNMGVWWTAICCANCWTACGSTNGIIGAEPLNAWSRPTVSSVPRTTAPKPIPACAPIFWAIGAKK